MKKLLSTLAVFALLVVSALSFTACGKKEATLKASDLTGDYITATVVFTAEGETESETKTHAEFLEIANPSAEYSKWYPFFSDYRVTAAGKILEKDVGAPDSEYAEENAEVATWEIKDNTLKVTYKEIPANTTYETVYENGKIVNTVTITGYGVAVITLEKAPAA